MYLLFLVGKQNAAAVSLAYAALKWIHGILSLTENPLGASICPNMVDAEKKSRKCTIVMKEPASLGPIDRKYTYHEATLKDLRLTTICVLTFAGLFRSKELLSIRVRYISWFIEDRFVINVPEIKPTSKERDSKLS